VLTNNGTYNLDKLTSDYVITANYTLRAQDGQAGTPDATTVVTIRIVGQDDAPELEFVGTTASFDANLDPADRVAIALAGAPTGITDVDDTLIEGARIIIRDVRAGDELVVLDPTVLDAAGIIASYDSTSGILTLEGTATLDDYQSALGAIGSRNLKPTVAGVTRTIDAMVYDGEKFSNAGMATIEIVGGGNLLAADDTGTARSDAHDSSAIVSESASGNVLANDTGTVAVTYVADPLGNQVAATTASIVQGLYGTLFFTSGGAYTYVPHDSLTLFGISEALRNHGDATRATLTNNALAFETTPLQDLFVYEAMDASGNLATATLTIDVVPSLRSVEANDDAATLPATRTLALTGRVLDNDTFFETNDGGPDVVAISRGDVAGGVLFDDGFDFPPAFPLGTLELTGRFGTLFMDRFGGYENASTPPIRWSPLCCRARR
jgi:hypothetical protein